MNEAKVALIMRGEGGNVVETAMKMAVSAYDVMLDTGVDISPLPIWPSQHPEALAQIQRDGFRVAQEKTA